MVALLDSDVILPPFTPSPLRPVASSDVRALALVLLLLAACGTACSGPAPAARIASPTPSSVVVTASPGPFAVVFGSGPGGQLLTIIGTDGSLHGQVSPRSRSTELGFPPSVSTSNSAVYYLDGDSALMRLRPGDAVGRQESVQLG